MGALWFNRETCSYIVRPKLGGAQAGAVGSEWQCEKERTATSPNGRPQEGSIGRYTARQFYRRDRRGTQQAHNYLVDHV